MPPATHQELGYNTSSDDVVPIPHNRDNVNESKHTEMYMYHDAVVTSPSILPSSHILSFLPPSSLFLILHPSLFLIPPASVTLPHPPTSYSPQPPSKTENHPPENQ